MDADLLFYLTTLDGAPIRSPGFLHVGADGLAWDDVHSCWARLDVEREWILVRALIEDPEARVEWLFVSDVVAAMLLEWGLANGDSPVTIERAREVMLQPFPGGTHDDHIHLRTACSVDEAASGCVNTGPERPWLSYDMAWAPSTPLGELVHALDKPIETEM